MDDLPALEPDFEADGRELVLNQDRYWWDIDGRRWPLDLMEFDYLRNVLRFLEDHASRLYHLQVSRAIINDEEPPPPAESRHEAVAWVRSTVLYEAIKQRIADWPCIEPAGTIVGGLASESLVGDRNRQLPGGRGLISPATPDRTDPTAKLAALAAMHDLGSEQSQLPNDD